MTQSTVACWESSVIVDLMINIIFTMKLRVPLQVLVGYHALTLEHGTVRALRSRAHCPRARCRITATIAKRAAHDRTARGYAWQTSSKGAISESRSSGVKRKRTWQTSSEAANRLMYFALFCIVVLEFLHVVVDVFFSGYRISTCFR